MAKFWPIYDLRQNPAQRSCAASAQKKRRYAVPSIGLLFRSNIPAAKPTPTKRMSPTTDAAAAAPPPPPPGPGEEPVVIKRSVITHVFFAFACAATVARAFEAGVVSSAMPRIAASLRLDYAQEGVVAAAPDYGIVPAGIIAMALFERVRARKVLVGACALPAVAAAAAALLDA